MTIIIEELRVWYSVEVRYTDADGNEHFADISQDDVLEKGDTLASILSNYSEAKILSQVEYMDEH